MLTLTDVLDEMLPQGTRPAGKGPPVTPVPVRRVAILDGISTPLVDRATLAIADAAAPADAVNLLSTAPAALVVSANHEVPDFAVDYPILILPPDAEPRAVADAVTRHLEDRQTRLAVQGIDVYRRLAELAIAGKGLTAIAAAVAVLLSLPVAVADEEWRPICAFGIDGAPTAPPEEHILRGLRERLRPILERERLSPSAPPVLHVSPPGEPHVFVAAPIVLPPGPVGYIWADSASAALFPLVDVTIGHAAAVCAIEMARERAVLEAQLHLRGNFVEELLTDGYRSIDAMRQRARFLGHDLDQPHLVAIFDIDQFARYIAARPVSSEGAIVKLKERFARLVAEALSDGDSALLWQQSDALVGLLPAAANAQPDDVAVRAERVRSMVQARLGGPSISCWGRAASTPTPSNSTAPMSRRARPCVLAWPPPAPARPPRSITLASIACCSACASCRSWSSFATNCSARSNGTTRRAGPTCCTRWNATWPSTATWPVPLKSCTSTAMGCSTACSVSPS